MEAAMPYSVADIPNLAGKLAVVTGATGGLGYETALGLAGAGATVVVTGRNAQKGADALARIHAVHPGADIRYENLDLASLASVAEFAEKFLTAGLPLDILINNAGVMALPERELTADGFERQFQTNYLGHFALTQRLLPALRKADAPRVVPLSSIAARSGAIDFGNLQSERRYNPMVTYSQTKLACLMFAFELQRRSDANGWGLKSIAAHPGVSASSLIENGMGASSLASLAKRFVSFIFQPVPQGALPTLFAATSSEAKAGGYYGPDGFAETRGLPTAAKPPRQSLDIAVARRLWEVSEDLTGLRFPALARAA
jgi:NAD(P)-dependent dehydrogenase (short-subunit alcohol dehydrogenase family)